jgi:hypothetical protein
LTLFELYNNKKKTTITNEKNIEKNNYGNLKKKHLSKNRKMMSFIF